MAASSILETFFILFKSNTDEVKKGTEDAKRSTGDLEQSLTRTEAAGAAMGEHLTEIFTTLAASLLAAFSAERVVAYTGEVAELNAQLGLTSRRLGIGVEDLYAWGQATEETGGSISGLMQTLDFLNKGMAMIATTGTSRLKPFFDELKIRVTDGPHHVRPLLDILGDLADRLSKLDAQGRAGIAEKLGIDEGLVLTLAQGRRGLEDLVKKQKEIGTVTQEDTEIAHKYGRSLEELGDRARLTATHIGSSILPALTDFFNWIGKIVDYLGEHIGVVEGFFIGVAGVITALYLPAAIDAAIATWAFLAPILAVVGPILALGAAFALVFEDVQNFLAGNKSVIGELSKTWPEIGETVRAAVGGAGEVWTWFLDLLKGGASVVGGVASLIVAAWGKVTGIFDGFGANLAAAFPFWTKSFQALGDLIEFVAKAVFGLAAAFAKLGLSAVVALPRALANFGHDTHALAGVVAGKDTLAHAFPEKDAAYFKKALAARDSPALPRKAWAPAPPVPAREAAKTPHMPAPAREAVKARASVQAGHDAFVQATGARAGIGAGQKQIRIADATPIAAQSRDAIMAGVPKSTTNNVTVNAPITVNAAEGMSAEEVGEHVANHIDKHVRQAINHNDDGVSH